MLGLTAYGSALVLLLLSAVPFETYYTWHKGIFVTAAAAIGALRIADGLLNSNFRVAEPLLLMPLIGVIALAVFQVVPFADGSPLSMDPYQTLTFIIVFGAVVVCGEVLFNYTRTKRRLQQLVALVLTIAIGSSVFGLCLELFQVSWPPINESYSQAQQSFAQFVNRNHFAVLVEMGLGLLAGILLKAELTTKTKLAGWLAVGLLIYSMIAASSRGGLVSMTGMGIFAVFVHFMTRSNSGRRIHESQADRNRRRFKLLHKVAAASGMAVLVLATVIALVAFIGDDRLITRIGRIDNEVVSANESGENRAAIWASTIEMIKERPLVGSGFGAYGAAITKFDSSNGRFSLEQAHNDYLEVLANGGVIAAVLFAAFGTLVGVRIIRNMQSPDGFRRACCFGAIVGIFGVLIHSFVDFGLHVLVNALVFTVLIVIGTAKIESQYERSDSQN